MYFFFFFEKKFFVVKVARYNTALARFRDNSALIFWKELSATDIKACNYLYCIIIYELIKLYLNMIH